MDEKILKWVSFAMLFVTIVVSGSLVFFPGLHEKAVMAEEARNRLTADGEKNITTVSQDENPDDIVEDLSNMKSQLIVEIPKKPKKNEVRIENDYLTQTVFIHFPDVVDDYFSEYLMRGSSDHISSLSYYKDSDEGVIALNLDKVYEVESDYSNGFLHLEFLDPHDVYDKVVVIDAGHGGRAAGAVLMNDYEKTINLDIMLATKALFDASDENIGVYYTRVDDSNPTLEQRVQLANKADADLFLSIHNNASNSGNISSLNGTQVLYSPSDDNNPSSKAFAKICLNNLVDELDSKKIGLLKADDILIVRKSDMPVALVEVGFITNRSEISKLKSKKYQQKAAKALYDSIIEAFDEGF